MLVITDHSKHTAENSLYPLCRALRLHPLCEYIDVASRSLEENHFFFRERIINKLVVSRVDEGFAFSPDAKAFKRLQRRVGLKEYDVILLRLSPPINAPFLEFLTQQYPDGQIINRPSGLLRGGNKAFLLEVADLCPPLRLCKNLAEIDDFARQFPIVLKPLDNYGGKGILRLDGEQVWIGEQRKKRKDLERLLQEFPQPYLAMKFLPNLKQGDKRIVVINKEVVGAALRFPAPNSWLCNVAQGGRAELATINQDEQHITKALCEVLHPLGVIIFGFDTLVDEHGKRVLSEINALSTGGLAKIAEYKGSNTIRRSAELIWDYVNEDIYGSNNLLP
jgi:glutathione synthase